MARRPRAKKSGQASATFLGVVQTTQVCVVSGALPSGLMLRCRGRFTHPSFITVLTRTSPGSPIPGNSSLCDYR